MRLLKNNAISSVYLISFFQHANFKEEIDKVYEEQARGNEDMTKVSEEHARGNEGTTKVGEEQA